MPKMKHLLRKLHIGSTTAATTTINNHDTLPHTPPLHDPDPLLTTTNTTTTTTPSSSALPSPTPTPIVPDPNPNNNFNLLEEEEFQMQLALAISASDSDVRKDPESAQIDAAKQISLGYEASLSDTQALVQFQSLRYWVSILYLLYTCSSIRVNGCFFFFFFMGINYIMYRISYDMTRPFLI